MAPGGLKVHAELMAAAVQLTTGCQVDSCQVRTALGGRAKVQEVGQGRECFGAVLGLNHCLQG